MHNSFEVTWPGQTENIRTVSATAVSSFVEKHLCWAFILPQIHSLNPLLIERNTEISLTRQNINPCKWPCGSGSRHMYNTKHFNDRSLQPLNITCLGQMQQSTQIHTYLAPGEKSSGQRLFQPSPKQERISWILLVRTFKVKVLGEAMCGSTQA